MSKSFFLKPAGANSNTVNSLFSSSVVTGDGQQQQPQQQQQQQLKSSFFTPVVKKPASSLQLPQANKENSSIGSNNQQGAGGFFAMLGQDSNNLVPSWSKHTTSVQPRQQQQQQQQQEDVTNSNDVDADGFPRPQARFRANSSTTSWQQPPGSPIRGPRGNVALHQQQPMTDESIGFPGLNTDETTVSAISAAATDDQLMDETSWDTEQQQPKQRSFFQKPPTAPEGPSATIKRTPVAIAVPAVKRLKSADGQRPIPLHVPTPVPSPIPEQQQSSESSRESSPSQPRPAIQIVRPMTSSSAAPAKAHLQPQVSLLSSARPSTSGNGSNGTGGGKSTKPLRSVSDTIMTFADTLHKEAMDSERYEADARKAMDDLNVMQQDLLQADDELNSVHIRVLAALADLAMSPTPLFLEELENAQRVPASVV